MHRLIRKLDAVLGAIEQARVDQRSHVSELEQLARYVTRPAIANERLSVNRAGQVVLKLKPVLSLSKGHPIATAPPTS